MTATPVVLHATNPEYVASLAPDRLLAELDLPQDVAEEIAKNGLLIIPAECGNPKELS